MQGIDGHRLLPGAVHYACIMDCYFLGYSSPPLHLFYFFSPLGIVTRLDIYPIACLLLAVWI